MKSDQKSPDSGKAANRPNNWVEKTPRPSGQAKKTSITGMVQSDSYQVKGTIGTLSGVAVIGNIPGTDNAGGAGTTLELTVERGKVRAYLQYVPESGSFVKAVDGYIYAEAEPGKPGKIKGVLQTLGGGFGYDRVYNLVFESLDGEAQGITYRLYR